MSRLARAGVGDIDDSTRRRAEYSTDASLYRVVPAAVAFPRDVDEVIATVEVCGELGVPVTARGAGTSIAGNAVGSGIVIDLSRHLTRTIDVDPAARTARVSSGVVLDELQRAAGQHGLRFGPDPSTHNRCTLGGMIANNACGSRALGFGRTVDHVLSLDMVTGSGRRLTVSNTAEASSEVAAALRLADEHAPVIREELGRFPRQVSGYGLHHLLEEHGRDVARALVGSEGTCGIVHEATVGLVQVPSATRLLVLGFDSIADAADATPAVLDAAPSFGRSVPQAADEHAVLIAIEGMDERIVDVVRSRRGVVPPLPRGRAWLLVEIAGPAGPGGEPGALPDARRIASAVEAVDHRIVDDAREARALWRIREDGAGLSGRIDGRAAHAGFEDAAVPPDRLGAYLRAFEQLVDDHGLDGIPYGHFGDGCVHVRLTFPFGRPDGQAHFRRFVTEAAELVAEHGGSLSGEHGDGRARSELLEFMFSSDMRSVFASFKKIFDPAGILNPGVLVDARPVDADLRAARPATVALPTAFAYTDDAGQVTAAVHRCTGIGRCRVTHPDDEQVMCPSYVATRDEKDSTRGRARVLQEMLDGGLVTDGWASDEVDDALDLCLGCKGCLVDCPASVDMATYRAEALHQRYRRRRRPRHHYTLGWLPVWARLASVAPRLATLPLRIPLVGALLTRLAGVDPRRELPPLASRAERRRLHQLRRGRTGRRPGPAAATAGPDAGTHRVVLWVDTFTQRFSPQVAAAAVRVLHDAGVTVELVPRSACCGLTYISTGQLDRARRLLERSVSRLVGYAREGIPIVGLEPSCTAVLRHDAPELLDTDDARAVGAATRTLAEVLATRRPEWTPPRLDDTRIVAQPHCHHRAVMGWEADRALLTASGAELRAVGGCCGLAGDFGMTEDHYDVSVAVAASQLLPAVEEADEDTVLLADGMSCRTQLADLAGKQSVHLATLLDDAIRRSTPR